MDQLIRCCPRIQRSLKVFWDRSVGELRKRVCLTLLYTSLDTELYLSRGHRKHELSILRGDDAVGGREEQLWAHMQGLGFIVETFLVICSIASFGIRVRIVLHVNRDLSYVRALTEKCQLTITLHW
jgi:hypothetical protein